MVFPRKRILVKVSGEALAGQGTIVDFTKVHAMAEKIITLVDRGMEVALICGGGNIRRHRDTTESQIDRVKSDHLGMIAGVMNAVILSESLAAQGANAVIHAAHAVQIPTVARQYNAIAARSDLTKHKIVICAGGTGSPYSTHDLAGVLRALELQCDVVVKATSVDGVYDKDPKKYADAVRFEELTLTKASHLRLDIMDHSALAMAMDNSLPIFVCNLNELEKFGTIEGTGTLVRPE